VTEGSINTGSRPVTGNYGTIARRSATSSAISTIFPDFRNFARFSGPVPQPELAVVRELRPCACALKALFDAIKWEYQG
jgi:hypothetical protein